MTQVEKKTAAIDILNADGSVVITIETERPEWSFEQYIRNRDGAGWRWEPSRQR